MIARLFKTRQTRPAAAIPPGQRVYAIGDVHGRRDLLERLLAMIEEDETTRGGARTTLVFLGDLIDRGPDSAGVLDLLSLLAAERDDVHFLMGNHEEVFLHALAGDERAIRFFCRIGGRETILSYGVTQGQFKQLEYHDLLLELASRVPAHHRTLLDSMEDVVTIGDYAFVHAGIRPGVALDQQKKTDLRWIRDTFLAHAGPFERMIIHGHTITEEVEVQPNRIGVDTGAFTTGRLTAIGLQGDERWFLQT